MDLWGLKVSDINGTLEEKISWLKEVTDIFSEVKIGFIDKASISIPNIIQLELELDIVSNDWVNNKGDESDSGMTSGVSLNFQVGNEDFPIFSVSADYSKKSPQLGNAFSLFDVDYEFTTEVEINKDFKVTPPIPFVNITLNLSEAADLLDKVGNAIHRKIKEGVK